MSRRTTSTTVTTTSRRRRARTAGVCALLALIAGAAGAGLGAAPQAAAQSPATPALSAADQARAATISTALAALAANAGELGFGSGGAAGLGRQDAVSVTDVIVEADGASHMRFARTFAGLPVLGGDFVVHRTAAGAWRAPSATLHAPLSLDLTPVVTATTATAAALAGATTISGVLPAGVPALVIDAFSAAPTLAWDVLTTGTQADGTPSLLHSYVDAVTGAVRFTDDEIETVDGTGNSLYLGKVKLSTVLGADNYELRDLTRGSNYTADAENLTDDCLPILLQLCTSTAPATLFTDVDNTWGSASLDDRQTTAVDAHYGSALTWDYFLQTHKRRGIANDGVGVYSRVHYGTAYANAFWNDKCRCMTYGDGDRDKIGPLVSLDISGHEISHGLTSHTAQLFGSGESGGLSEATSDIFGTMIEFFANNKKDVGDYLIGEMPQQQAHDESGAPAAIRYMYRPSLDRSSPDCFSRTVANLGVHESAGVANHFFYLLAEGSKAKKINGFDYRSPTCNDDPVKGIGRDAAAQVWYRALTMYFTSATDYSAARVATLRAAEDVFGAKGPQIASVIAAWDAVSVTAASRPLPPAQD